jgi:hypothetical protein
MGKALLKYYIYEALLTGQLDGKLILMSAMSGGGSMSKLKITDPTVVNNPYAWTKKATYKSKKFATPQNRGGPIPPGEYEIGAPDSSRGYLASFLKPLGPTAMLLKRINRDGFLIHGSGKYGSDGCIVPSTPADYQKLMNGLKADKGGKLIVLSFLYHWKPELTEVPFAPVFTAPTYRLPM